ncbi:methyltransferase domain-containing protein [Patescibacteria group bacterium]|nr:methyltransferase domain-containing protein [Patescibacteria group bacterium]
MTHLAPTRSLLRREEYKAIQSVVLNGEVLDIGGVPDALYHTHIKGSHHIVTANIDPTTGADYTFDAQKPWPLPSESFNGVVCMNVLEHLYTPAPMLAEARRVLSAEGKIVGTVPFLFHIHASPDDYFRYTKSALTRLLSDAGFTHIQVKELGTGAFAVLYHSLVGFMRWNWMASFFMMLCTGIDRLIYKIRPHNQMSAVEFPLGYIFEASVPKK